MKLQPATIFLYVNRLILLILGLVVGEIIGKGSYELMEGSAFLARLSVSNLLYTGTLMAIFAIIGFIIAQLFTKLVLAFLRIAEQRLKSMPFSTLISTTLGLIVGLLIAMLLSNAVRNLPIVGPYMPILIALVFGYLGVSMGYRWKDMVDGLLNSIRMPNRKMKKDVKDSKEAKAEEVDAVAQLLTFKSTVHPKVLDTSVIIDGRIVEICRAGFLEGPLVIANFVLDELRHIADSSDSLKRVRGRRGLDVLNDLQKVPNVEILNVSIDYEEILEVDAKLVQLAKDVHGYVVTNDFNLNKVASFQKVKTLNVNELAGAIKTLVLPGESMRVEIVGRGKENDQGVGYLDDGTMIVVENGKDAIGQIVDTIVTSVIQTNAGRMIFVRLA